MKSTLGDACYWIKSAAQNFGFHSHSTYWKFVRNYWLLSQVKVFIVWFMAICNILIVCRSSRESNREITCSLDLHKNKIFLYHKCTIPIILGKMEYSFCRDILLIFRSCLACAVNKLRNAPHPWWNWICAFIDKEIVHPLISDSYRTFHHKSTWHLNSRAEIHQAVLTFFSLLGDFSFKSCKSRFSKLANCDLITLKLEVLTTAKFEHGFKIGKSKENCRRKNFVDDS